MFVEVDPDGDLMITVQPSIGEFAPWPTKSLEPKEPASILSKTVSANASPTTKTRKRARDIEPEDSLQVVINSQVLGLASRRFKKMLTGNWIEAKVHPDGKRHVGMEGFQESAILIVMRIIHFQHSKVPEELDEDQLAQVAVVVDDLDCLEAIKPWTDRWIEQYREKVTKPDWKYSRSLIIWLLITSVLKPNDKFVRLITSRVIRLSSGPVDSLGLPIRQCLLDKIEVARQHHFTQILDFLHDQLGRLLRQDHPLKCNNSACADILYGSLTRVMANTSPPLYPRPTQPFFGLSLSDLLQHMNAPGLPHEWYDENEEDHTVSCNVIGLYEMSSYINKGKHLNAKFCLLD